MGAKERAGQRGKKAAKGSMKGQPKSQKQLNQSILVPDLNPASRSRSLQAWGKFTNASSPGGHNGFSMSEEARNTDRRTHTWGETNLRSKGIAFVSAGPLKREEDAWNTVSEDESPQKQSDAEPVAEVSDHEVQGIPSLVAVSESYNEEVLSTEKDKDVPKLLVEELGPEPRGQASTPAAPTVTAPGSPGSDSEEEIVFSGRAGASRQPSRKPTPLSQHSEPAPASEALPNPQTTNGHAPATSQHHTLSTTTSVWANSAAIDSNSPTGDANAFSTPSKRAKKLPFGRKYDEDELMQDYIDNMALGDSEEEDQEEPAEQNSRRKPFKKTETFRMFNGDGLENAKVQTNGKKKASTYAPVQAIDWDSDDLADFDDLSTTDEEVEDVGQVIRHRTRASGAQYLVVANGAEASMARWILHSKMLSDSAIKEIEIYEEIRRMDIQEDELEDDEDGSDSDEDEEALQDLIDNIESEDDENARIISYTARMTDEQIARALAKQEELGLGSDELMLFDGEAADGESPVDDAFGGGDDFIPFDLGKHTSNRGRSKRNKKQRDSFPSAGAFADALDQDPYGAFDVMDFERPSLKPKKNGRKSDFPWDLGDLDDGLRDQLVNTWTKDREKKAERKRQREEDRLNATLDLAEGGDPAIIKARIRQFLVQEIDVLKLSPMESSIRAAVHRLAKALKLNSHSEGKEGIGAGRYPVLTKTPRTPFYTIETIWEIDALMNTRKFFPKNTFGRSNKTPRSAGAIRPRRTGGGGGGVMSGVSYRDGEEVGASAPEIGSDNKGRAMLEKMGWSSGMGIGAEGNKGNLNHVRHIVKTTKAGLG